MRQQSHAFFFKKELLNVHVCVHNYVKCILYWTASHFYQNLCYKFARWFCFNKVLSCKMKQWPNKPSWKLSINFIWVYFDPEQALRIIWCVYTVKILSTRIFRSVQTVQTQITAGAIWSGSTMFAILSASLVAFMYSKTKLLHFRTVTIIILGVTVSRIFMVYLFILKSRICSTTNEN